MATHPIDRAPARSRSDEVVGAAVIIVLAGMVFPFAGVVAAVLLRRTLLHDHPTAQRVLLGVGIAMGVLLLLFVVGVVGLLTWSTTSGVSTPVPVAP